MINKYINILKIILFASAIISVNNIFATTSIIDDISDIKGENGGRTVVNFLTLPLSASQLSIGGIASAPDDPNATAVYSSPASTAYLTQYKFTLSHVEWLMGLRKEFLGALFPLLDRGTLGVYSQVFSYGKFDYARDIDEQVSKPRAVDYSLGISYAQQIIHKKLAMGLSAAYLESRLDKQVARGITATGDIIFRPNHILSSGLYFRNIGNRLKYNDTKEKQPLQTGLNFRIEPISKDPEKNPRGRELNFTIGALKTIDAPLEIAGGVEFRPIKQFALRTGYDHFISGNSDIGGISAGIGIDVKKYGVDAGWKYQSTDFGSVWAITVKYKTDEMAPKTAEDYFRVAQRYFNRKKYNSTINYAQKALILNPNMWKAHSLTSMALSALHRKNGSEIALIYTGNIQGKYSSRSSGGFRLGGLSRIVSKINEERKIFPTTFTVDAGNFITSHTSLAKAQFSQKYFIYAGYDATAAGIEEIAFGDKRVGLDRSEKEYLCTNCRDIKNLNTVESKIITKDGYKIAFLNIVSSGILKNDIKSKAIELARQTQNREIREANLRVVFVNDSWEAVKFYANSSPLADIIICGNLDQKFEKGMKINNSIILSAGENGNFLGEIALRFNKNKKLTSFTNTLFQITEDILPDPTIEKLVYKEDTNDKLSDLKIDENILEDMGRQGVFAFISDRRGRSNIFLKVIDKMAEFPLTANLTTSSKPQISFRNNAILYLETNAGGDSTLLHKMNITGKNDNVINFNGSINDALYSPDNKWIYASVKSNPSDKYDIYRIKAGDIAPVKIIGWKDGNEKEISFSHDGKNMLFTSDRDGKSQVYISNQKGLTPLRLTDANAATSSSPIFSPLDKYIAYLSDRGNFNNKKDLWIYNRETGKTVQITRDANVSSFLWLDDIGTILYTAGINLTDMNTINILTGVNKKIIVSDNKKDYSEKNPMIFVYKDRKRILYVREQGDNSRTIHMCDFDGSNDKRIVLDNGNSWLE